MADYNLGTAHGKIEIGYDDKGIKQAEQSFQRLQNISKKFGGAMVALGNTAEGLGRSFIRMNGGVAATWTNVNKLSSSLIQFHNIANRATDGANRLIQAYRGINNAVKLVRTIGQTFLGLWLPAWDKLGKVTQEIFKLRAALDTLKMAGGILVALNIQYPRRG